MNKWDAKEGSEQRRDGLGSGVQFPSGLGGKGRGGSEGGNWETREETTALVQVSDDGDWARAGARQVEKSR